MTNIHIDNQIIEINGDSTRITVVNDVRNFVHKLNFNFADYPKHKDFFKEKDFAQYWWLSTLYNSFLEATMPGTQLKLF